MLAHDQAWQVLRDADRVVSAVEIEAALRRLGSAITARLSTQMPLVVTIMIGAEVFGGRLLPLLAFPLECDYAHVTRYRDTTRGGRLEWIVRPRVPLAGRTVLILDDILDEGTTLAAVRDDFLCAGARTVLSAVLVDKAIGRSKPVEADFVGIVVPDRYVFGFGMDVNGAWRNLPEIYAVRAA